MKLKTEMSKDAMNRISQQNSNMNVANSKCNCDVCTCETCTCGSSCQCGRCERSITD